MVPYYSKIQADMHLHALALLTLYPHSSLQLLQPRFPAAFRINHWSGFIIGALYKLCLDNS